MPTYVLLAQWTEQGVKNVKETVNRFRQGQKLAEQFGGRLNGYWTQGEYDLVVTAEFPDEESANAFILSTAAGGAVRTKTLRAYTADEMERILQRLP